MATTLALYDFFTPTNVTVTSSITVPKLVPVIFINPLNIGVAVLNSKPVIYILRLSS